MNSLEHEFFSFEIIVVDDNSPDGTSEVVRTLMKSFPPLRLLTRTSDKGLVPSIHDGIQHAKGDICIWMDADLSMSPILIKSMVKELENGADLVVGSRYIKGGCMKGADPDGHPTSLLSVWRTLSSTEDSFLSAMISKTGNLVVRAILKSPLHDHTSGFFCSKKKTLLTVGVQGSFVDYCISLPYRCYMKGLNVVEVPMVLTPRKYGKSKTSNDLSSIISVAYQCIKAAFILKITVKSERSERYAM